MCLCVCVALFNFFLLVSRLVTVEKFCVQHQMPDDIACSCIDSTEWLVNSRRATALPLNKQN